jgi:hypothetical protein
VEELLLHLLIKRSRVSLGDHDSTASAMHVCIHGIHSMHRSTAGVNLLTARGLARRWLKGDSEGL